MYLECALYYATKCWKFLVLQSSRLLYHVTSLKMLHVLNKKIKAFGFNIYLLWLVMVSTNEISVWKGRACSEFYCLWRWSWLSIGAASHDSCTFNQHWNLHYGKLLETDFVTENSFGVAYVNNNKLKRKDDYHLILALLAGMWFHLYLCVRLGRGYI